MIRYCFSCMLKHSLKPTTENNRGQCDFCESKLLQCYVVHDPSLLPRSTAVNDMLDRKRART